MEEKNMTIIESDARVKRFFYCYSHHFFLSPSRDKRASGNGKTENAKFYREEPFVKWVEKSWTGAEFLISES